MSMLGHNRPPQDGHGFRKHAWGKARKALLGNALPVEIVRQRIARAKVLGLSYPQYASILIGSGRDILGFLFTVDGLQLKLSRDLQAPDIVLQKLPNIEGKRLAFSPSGEIPQQFQTELEALATCHFHATGPEPSVNNWPASRTAVQGVLGNLKLPSKSVVMIGDGVNEPHWAVAGRLARFIPTSEYFN